MRRGVSPAVCYTDPGPAALTGCFGCSPRTPLPVGSPAMTGHRHQTLYGSIRLPLNDI